MIDIKDLKNGWTERNTERWIENGQTERLIDKKTEKHKDRQTEQKEYSRLKRDVDAQKDKQTERQ